MSEKIKILYIDDEPMNIQIFKISFSKKYDIITGFSGDEGLKLLERNPEIDVVISDMKMPEMNGVEFLKKAKKIFPDKKYYILTGFDIVKEIQSAIDSKIIIKCFKKPININKIVSSINEATN